MGADGARLQAGGRSCLVADAHAVRLELQELDGPGEIVPAAGGGVGKVVMVGRGRLYLQRKGWGGSRWGSHMWGVHSIIFKPADCRLPLPHHLSPFPPLTPPPSPGRPQEAQPLTEAHHVTQEAPCPQHLPPPPSPGGPQEAQPLTEAHHISKEAVRCLAHEMAVAAVLEGGGSSRPGAGGGSKGEQ